METLACPSLESMMTDAMEPLFGLRLSTPRLALTLPRETDFIDLIKVAEGGIHPPTVMPFTVPWTDAIGSEGFHDEFIAFHRRALRDWRLDSWSLLLGVWADGRLAGVQELRAERFLDSRKVGTGSWLGQRFQSVGYGTEMRAAVLALAFAGLGAELAESGANEGNIASMRVSEKLGYEFTGTYRTVARTSPVLAQRYRLTRERWEKTAHIAVRIEGLEPCLRVFGLNTNDAATG
jgi:RimJ/RimL family protein N-acetyltransferase